MFKYIAGNSLKHALNASKSLIKKQKIPIINYAIEKPISNDQVRDEFNNINKNLTWKDPKIALKLSLFDFNMDLITNVVEDLIQNDVQILIDAESNDKFDEYTKLTNKLIIKYNMQKTNIIKTYQMYRKDSLDNLIEDMKKFNDSHYLGVKMVRGAYWNSDYESNKLLWTKQCTDFNYNRGILELADRNSNSINILATHNNESINLGHLLNNKYGKTVFEFGHLMGMRDKRFTKLVDEGQIVNVYVPYGPYKHMIPYLTRRLYENIDTMKYMIN